MSAIQVEGLRSLYGEIKIQGSKNAVLPMMAAAILNKGTTVITNVPRIQDVYCMMGILEYMGCQCQLSDHQLTIHAQALTSTQIPEHYVKSMRSSIMILGALLGRTGEAATHYPGGCIIGKRPIDLHLHVLRELGASIVEEDESITACAKNLTGADITLSFPSVGATENGLLASVLAKGRTVLRGCAKEPEIEELCYFLNNMGADISGIGTDCLVIEGKENLHDCVFPVVGDRIVAGTYLAAVMAATGNVRLSGIQPSHMDAVVSLLSDGNTSIVREKHALCITSTGRPGAFRIKTGPYPEFPTDLQSPMMAVLSVSKGAGRIEENIFEGRYETAKELQKMRAQIRIEERQAYIHGTYPLSGCAVDATDLRGGAALVVAGLASEGITVIRQCHHILRGYEDICHDLTGVGAVVTYMNLS